MLRYLDCAISDENFSNGMVVKKGAGCGKLANHFHPRNMIRASIYVERDRLRHERSSDRDT